MAERTEVSREAPARLSGILDCAAAARASDIHFEPTAEGMTVRYRIDGLLREADRFDAAAGRALVTRLMVMAGLLTYRLDVPQEGRLAHSPGGGGGALDLRLAVMPTTHGLRAAVRLPAELTSPRRLDELDLPGQVAAGLKRFAAAEQGLLLLTGPAGCGKTTTIYALLDHIVQTQPGTSVIALEDPVERDLKGVTQIQVSPFGELTYERALKSIVRQDPQVLMIGEIRDPATASIAIQAALSGHRLISTLHAGSPATAIARLMEMGVAPYQICSTLDAVITQRLLRRKANAGYAGRVPTAEWAPVDGALRKAIAERADADRLARVLGEQANHRTMRHAAEAMADAGITDRAEIDRVLGAA